MCGNWFDGIKKPRLEKGAAAVLSTSGTGRDHCIYDMDDTVRRLEICHDDVGTIDLHRTICHTYGDVVTFQTGCLGQAHDIRGHYLTGDHVVGENSD